MDLYSLNRKQLQALCKKNGVPANKTNREMADLLASALKASQNLAPEDPGKADNESDSKDLPKRLKIVRFSPENEMHVYEPSAVRPKVRRRTMVVGSSKESIWGTETEGQRISGEVGGNPTRNLRSRVQNAVEKDVDTVALPVVGKKRGRGSKKIESNKEENVDVNGNPPFIVEMGEVDWVVQDEAEINRGLARRQLRSREVIIEETVEGRREDFPLQRKNAKSGRLGKRRNGKDSQGSFNMDEGSKLEKVPTILRSARKNSALEKKELAGMTTRSRAKLEEKSNEDWPDIVVAKAPLSKPISVAKSRSTEVATQSIRSRRKVAEVSCSAASEAKSVGVKEGCKGQAELSESWKSNRNSHRCKSVANQKAAAGNRGMEVKKETKRRIRNSDFKVVTEGESSVETREDTQKFSFVLRQSRRSRHSTVLSSSMASSDKTGIGEDVGRIKQLGQKVSGTDIYAIDQHLKTKRNASRHSFVPSSSETDIVLIGNIRQERRICDPALEKETSAVGEKSPRQSRRLGSGSDSVGACELSNTIEKKKQTPFRLPVVTEESTSTGNISPSGGGLIGGTGLTRPQATEDQNYSSLNSIEDVFKSGNNRTTSKSKWIGKRKTSFMDVSSIYSDMKKGIGVKTQSEEILASVSSKLQAALTDQEALQIASEPLIVDAATNAVVDEVQQSAADGLTPDGANDHSCGPSRIGADFSIGDLSAPELLEFQAKNCDVPAPSSGLSSANYKTASESKWSRKRKTSFMGVSSINSDMRKGTHVRTHSEATLDSAYPKLQAALTDQEALEIGGEPLIADAATNVGVNEIQKSAANGLSLGAANDQSCRPSGICADFSIGNSPAPEQLEFQADVPSPSIGLSSARNLPFAGWKGVAIEELSAAKDDTVAVNSNPIECVGPSIKECGFHDLERSQKGIKTEKTEHEVLHPNMRASLSAEANVQLDSITISSHERAVAQVCNEENIGLEESSHKLTKAEKGVHDFFNVEDLCLNASEVNDADRVDHRSAADVTSKSPGMSFSLPKLDNSHQQEYLLQDQHTLSVTKRAAQQAQKCHSYDADAVSEELMASNSHFKDRKEALEGINPCSLFHSSSEELVDEKREYPSMEKCQQHSRNLTAEEKENEKAFSDSDGEKASFSEATAPMRDEELVSEMLHDNGTMFSEREGSNGAVKGESPNITREKRLGSQECSTEYVHVHVDITEGDSVHVNAYTTEGGSPSVQWYDICDLEMSTSEGDITTDEVEFKELYSNKQASLTSDRSFQLDGHDLFSFGKAASQVTGVKVDLQQEEDQAEDPHALSVTRTNSVERTARKVRESENFVSYPCDVDVAVEKMWTSNSKCEGELEALGEIQAGSLSQTSAKEFQDIDQGNSLMEKSSSDEVFCKQDSGDFAAEDGGEKVGFDSNNVKVLLFESSTLLSSPESHYNRKSIEENCSGDSVVGVSLCNTSQKIISVGTFEESTECGEEFLPYMVSANGGLNKTTNRVEDKAGNSEDKAGHLDNSKNVNILDELADNSFFLVDNPTPIGVKAADMMESIGSMASNPMVTFHGSEANKFEAEVREVNTEGNCTENILYSAKRDENSSIASQILRIGQKQAKKSSAGDLDTRACQAAHFLRSDLRSSNMTPTRSGSTNNSDMAEKTPSFSMLGNMVLTGYNSNKLVDVEPLCNASSPRLRKDADCPPLSPVTSCSYYADNTPSEFQDETVLFTKQELSLFQSNEEQGCKDAGGTYGSSTSKFSGHAMQEQEKAAATTKFDGQVTEQQLTPDILKEPENASSPCVQGITDLEVCTTSGITNILDRAKMRGTSEQSILEKASHDMSGTMPHPSCNEQEMNCSAKIILGVDNLSSKLDITLYRSTVARQNDSASNEEDRHSNVSNDTDGKEVTYDRGSSSSEVAQLFQVDSKIIAGDIGRAQESIGCLNDTKEVSRLETSKEDYQGFDNFLLDEHEDTVNEAAVNSSYVGLHCLPCLDNNFLSVVQFNECSDNKSLNITSALDCNEAVNCSTASAVHASNHDNKALEPNLLFEEGEHYMDGKSDSKVLKIDLISDDALEVQENEMLIEKAAIPVAEEQDGVKKHQMEEELSEQNCIYTAVLDKPKCEEVGPLKMPEHSHCSYETLKEAAESNDYHNSALSEFKVEYDPSNEQQENVADFSIEVAGQAAQLTREVSNQGSEEEPPGITTLDVSQAGIAPKDDQTSQSKMLTLQKTSSHAKRKENSLYAKRLSSSVMKSTKVRTGAIQVTPQKIQHHDDRKENESNTKIHKPGIVTAPTTMSNRRALWDISKN